MPIRGGTVCRMHGGGAKQVQQKAKERLAALVDPAITKLGKLVRSKRDQVALGAVNSVLEKNGFGGVQKIEQINYSEVTVEVKNLAMVLSPDELQKIKQRLLDQAPKTEVVEREDFIQ